MRKSTFALIGFSFAAGVVLMIGFMPLLNREPGSAAMTTAKLTIQKRFRLCQTRSRRSKGP
jgi:hypothetical protein